MPRRGENIRKRKDNRWEGRYIKSRTPTGKAIYASVYGKTYSIVKEKLKSVSTEESGLSKGGKLTFREALLLWLENNKVKQKVQTYNKYLQLINTQIIPELGDIQLSLLNYCTINRFIAKKDSNGRLDKCGGLSASYIQTMCFIINSTINFCEDNGFCAHIHGKIIRPVKQKKEIKVLSFEEQKILEYSLINNINENNVGMLISLYAGLRLGEVCGLQWKDIDFDKSIIQVNCTVERIKNLENENSTTKTLLVVTDTKSGNSTRVIPISGTLKSILLQLKGNDCEYIIQGKKKPYADPRTLQYAFKKQLAKCNLPDINYHALRHTFATRCVEAGVDIKSLSEMLGHANVNITLNTYVHSSLEQKQVQIEKLNSYCGQFTNHLFIANCFVFND